MSRKKKLSDKEFRHDAYHRRAKKAGFRSRAIFKLEEVDQRFTLLERGARVLDLGCAPGSWLQYARSRVGDRGVLVGIDRFAIEPAIPDVRMIVGDIYDTTREELLGDLEAFDVVMSDMAPDTTGIRHVDQTRCEVLFERALDVADMVLRPGGHFVGKLFQGPEFPNLLKRCRAGYERVKVVKPAGSRQQSIEQYIVCMARRSPG